MKEKMFSLSKKDFRIDTFKVSGNGGQKVNKTESGVRITHFDSGVVASSTESRSQHENKRIAFKRLTEDKIFKTWIKIQVGKMRGTLKSEEQINKEVDNWMTEENLKIETFKGSYD